MSDVRAHFLDATAHAVALLGRSELGAQWTAPSVLAEFSIAGLAGHLVRGMTTVETYLDRPEPEGPPISAAAYYHVLALPTDPNTEMNRGVRDRGEQEAAGGLDELAARARATHERVAARLGGEREDRLVQVAGDQVLTLDDYLCTRIVEVVVHSDDLALSLGVDTVPPSPGAAGIAISTLVEVARIRHGDTAVLRALTRRERDRVDALRVL